MTITRADEYVLNLGTLKTLLSEKINQCMAISNKLHEIKLLEDYDAAATVLEKSNIDNLTTMVDAAILVLQALVWE
jgi:hypothetical protein